MSAPGYLRWQRSNARHDKFPVNRPLHTERRDLCLSPLIAARSDIAHPLDMYSGVRIELSGCLDTLGLHNCDRARPLNVGPRHVVRSVRTLLNEELISVCHNHITPKLSTREQDTVDVAGALMNTLE